MSAPGADAAQPGTAPDGQGQGQDPSSEYTSVFGEDAFSDAPEELRPHLQKYVQTQVDPRLTQRFQEAAQFRQTWEPFSQIEGLADLHPEDVDQLVELGYALAAAGDEQHPGNQQALEAVRETWEAIGEQFGFTNEDGTDAEDDEEPEYMTREEFEAELQQRDQQRQQQETMAQTQSQIQQEIRGLVDKLPLGEANSPEREKAERALYSFMLRYDDAQMSNGDVVKAAYEDYTDLVGGAQSDLLENHEETGTTVNGGRADNAPEEVHGWREADKLAKARLVGSQ